MQVSDCASSFYGRKTEFKFQASLGGYFGHNAADMPTAIVFAYTLKGFVVGADGRRTDYESDRPVNDDKTQKHSHRRITPSWFHLDRFSDYVITRKQFSLRRATPCCRESANRHSKLTRWRGPAR